MLRDVFDNCDIEYIIKNNNIESSTNYDKMTEALKKYGFSMSSSMKSYPSIATGAFKDNKEESGHVWIESGEWKYLARHYYTCWTLTGRKLVTDFEKSDEEVTKSDMTYCVWGWSGSFDGWYREVKQRPDNNQNLLWKNNIYINSPK